MNTSKRKKTSSSSSTVVTSSQATSSSTVATPESQTMVTETEEQDLTNLEPQPSNVDEMCTPTSTSLAVESYTASAPASFAVDPCSASSQTSGASVVSTPLSTAYSCQDCSRRVKKSHNLQRANTRLKTKVQSLKKEVSSLRQTIAELESVSFIHLHILPLTYLPIFVLLPYMYCTCCTCTFIHSPACLAFSFHPLKKIMTCKYFLLFCFTLAFIRQGNGDGR